MWKDREIHKTKVIHVSQTNEGTKNKVMISEKRSNTEVHIDEELQAEER